MSYRIDPDESIGREIRRIAHEQAARALDDLTSVEKIGPVTAVHNFRKHCKKLRGLVRLVRPAMADGQYRAANTSFRDAARALSAHRDAHALLATFDSVVAASTNRSTGGLGAVREVLAQCSRAETDAVAERSESIEQALDLLHDGRAQIDDWCLDSEGWDAIAGGLGKTYGRGVDALASVVASPTAANHHELRKRAKYTWYHVRLLTDAAPSMLRPLAKQFHDLTDGLGDAHDLSVLRDRLQSAPDDYGGSDVVTGALVVLDGRRTMLEDRSARLASRLYAERPKHFTRRMGRYWTVRSEFGPERPVGEIAALFEQSDELDDLTVAELRQLAAEIELTRRGSRRRDDLLGALRAHGIRTP